MIVHFLQRKASSKYIQPFIIIDSFGSIGEQWSCHNENRTYMPLFLLIIH